MNAIDRYLMPVASDRRDYRREGASLPDWFIRRVLGYPPSGEFAIRQAAYSAQALEEDREVTRG